MRVLTLAVLLIPSVAAADSFFEIAGGLSTPVGDDDWNDAAEPSPKLALRAGSTGGGQFGGYAAAEWIPQNTDIKDASGPLASADYSAQRFRLLIGGAFEAPINRALFFTGRVGIGADIDHASATFTVLGAKSETTDTDLGFAFDVGVGLWAKVGSVQIGGELSLPIGHHDHPADDQGEIPFEWTSYDLDIMAGVRFVQ